MSRVAAVTVPVTSGNATICLIRCCYDAVAGLETSSGTQPTKLQSILSPDPSELPNDFQMPIWDHLEELRERVMIGGLAALVAITVCFCFSKDLVVFLEAPVAMKGVRFLQLSPGEFFFTTFKVRSML